jgi:PAS domain S-box-containing protein
MESTFPDDRELFRTAMEHSAIGMALVKPDGHFLKVNQALCRIVGYTEAELLATDFQSLTHPDDLPSDLHFVQQTLHGEIDHFQMEKRYFHKDGRIVWILLNVALVRDHKRNPLHFISQIQDINERKLSEEKIRQSEAMMAAAERIAHFGSWELDLAKTEVDANPLRWSDECFRIFGFEPGSVRITNELFFSRIPREDHETIKNAVSRAIAEHGVYSVEHRVLLPDGEIRHVHEQAKVVVHAVTGQPVKMVGTVHDVTERLRAMEEMLRAKEEAEAAVRTKSEFLAMISHEIRTPLNPILGAAQLLLGEECAPEQRELLQIIQNAGEHLLTLLSDILDLAKLESGGASLSLSPCQIGELVKGVLDIKSEDARRKNLALNMQLDSHLAFCYLLDEPRMRQILLNLIGNAVKFTNEGGVTVRIERLETGQKRDRLRFAISDTGIGLVPEHTQRIFEPFFQVDSSATRRYEGAGLGLSICRRLVEMMGGDIGVESHHGQGSTFWFSVWLERRRSLAGSGTPWPIPLTNGHRRSILLVEDDEQSRVILATMLEHADCEVAQAQTGASALALFRPGAFDMVLLNLHLPDLSGCETASLLRERERAAGSRPVAIIAQTTSASENEVRATDQAGMNGLLIKPIRHLDLLNLLNRHIPSLPVANKKNGSGTLHTNGVSHTG